MSDIICVTNRSLCGDDFLKRVERIAAAGAAGIILREKDLSESEYRDLAKPVMKICLAHNVPCILHSFTDAAIELGAEAIHMPLGLLREMPAAKKAKFRLIGASCHSLAEALEARRLGCGYITAGHVFDTECKRDLPGRGLEFLRAVCAGVDIPVYGIGGIARENIAGVRAAGADGACVMSGLMRCADVEEYLKGFESTSPV